MLVWNARLECSFLPSLFIGAEYNRLYYSLSKVTLHVHEGCDITVATTEAGSECGSLRADQTYEPGKKHDDKGGINLVELTY